MKKGDCFTTILRTKDGVVSFSIERMSEDWPSYLETEKIITSLAEAKGLKAVSNAFFRDGKNCRSWWFLNEDLVEPEGRGHDDVEALFALGWEPNTTTIFEGPQQ